MGISVVTNYKTEELKPYDTNTRLHGEEQLQQIEKSIKEFGFQQPIVVDKNNIIIAGHTRLEAAKQLKLKEVPVVVAKNLSDNQAKAYRLMDNRSGQESNWDKKLLELELSLLNDENINVRQLEFLIKSGSFDDLDKNRQMMLTELAFNLGYSENTTFGKGQDGLAEFDDFMKGIANNDYALMNKEYTRLNLDTRNKNFYTIFLSPSLDKL